MLSRIVFDILHVGYDDGYHAGFQSFAVDENLCHVLTLGINILNFLRSDIFALRQLEDVLLPVDDFQSAVLLRNKMKPESTTVQAHLQSSSAVVSHVSKL